MHRILDPFRTHSILEHTVSKQNSGAACNIAATGSATLRFNVIKQLQSLVGMAVNTRTANRPCFKVGRQTDKRLAWSADKSRFDLRKQSDNDRISDVQHNETLGVLIRSVQCSTCSSDEVRPTWVNAPINPDIPLKHSGPEDERTSSSYTYGGHLTIHTMLV